MSPNNKVYLATVVGTFLGLAVSAPLMRHVTIPPMEWGFIIRFLALAGVIFTPVILGLMWMTLRGNRAQKQYEYEMAQKRG